MQASLTEPAELGDPDTYLAEILSWDYNRLEDSMEDSTNSAKASITVDPGDVLPARFTDFNHHA